MQLSSEEAPRTDDHVPAGQSKQASVPFSEEAVKVPASHCRQSKSEMDPLRRVVEPAGHGMHSVWDARPVEDP